MSSLELDLSLSPLKRPRVGASDRLEKDAPGEVLADFCRLERCGIRIASVTELLQRGVTNDASTLAMALCVMAFGFRTPRALFFVHTFMRDGTGPMIEAFTLLHAAFARAKLEVQHELLLCDALHGHLAALESNVGHTHDPRSPATSCTGHSQQMSPMSPLASPQSPWTQPRPKLGATVGACEADAEGHDGARQAQVPLKLLHEITPRRGNRTGTQLLGGGEQ